MRALRATAGRADLVRALAAGGREGLETAAALLGFGEKAQDRADTPVNAPLSALAPGAQEPMPAVRGEKLNFAPIPFLRVVAVEYHDGKEIPATPAARVLDLDPPRRRNQPAMPPLVAWPRLWRILEDLFRQMSPGTRLDVTALVAEIARGRVIRRLPPRLAPSLGQVRVLFDRSPRLMPFWQDQLALARALRRRLGPWLRLGLVPGGDPEAIIAGPGHLLVVSDLGYLGEAGTRASWERAGERLACEGTELAALVPCPRERWGPKTSGIWSPIEWEKPAFAAAPLPPRGQEELKLRRDAVLQLLRPAIRIEPGLLREVRHLMGAEADAGTEADVWATFPNPSSVAATPPLDRGESSIRAEPEPALRQAAFAAIGRWHEELPPLVLAEETLLTEDVSAEPEERDRARQYLRAALARVRANGPAREPYLAQWFRELAERLPSGAADPQLAGELVATWSALHQADPSLPLPRWVSPILLAAVGGTSEPRQFSLWQNGKRIELRPAGAAENVGSLLGEMRSSSPRIAVLTPSARPLELVLDGEAPGIELEQLPRELRLVSDLEAIDLIAEARPSWASAAGRDRYGLWADLTVEGVVQRMRYLFPGRFLMGSPKSEAGRYDDEAQHSVILTQGFWLADTPCTQALWQAIMRTNPSRFRSRRRPVERVNWTEAQSFVRTLQQRLDATVEARLPTEAEWEYACRAGTTTSTYAGELEILGERNGPLLDRIAWYGGNSGVGFELDNGHDSSIWREKQFEHERAGTREVAGKDPNPWGLYDTLGNVWEWCADYREEGYPAEVQTDPTGPTVGNSRVLRGGSWIVLAGRVRAAFRGWNGPGLHSASLGFRFSLGCPRSGPGAERTESGRRGAPSQGVDRPPRADRP